MTKRRLLAVVAMLAGIAALLFCNQKCAMETHVIAYAAVSDSGEVVFSDGNSCYFASLGHKPKQIDCPLSVDGIAFSRDGLSYAVSGKPNGKSCNYYVNLYDVSISQPWSQFEAPYNCTIDMLDRSHLLIRPVDTEDANEVPVEFHWNGTMWIRNADLPKFSATIASAVAFGDGKIIFHVHTRDKDVTNLIVYDTFGNRVDKTISTTVTAFPGSCTVSTGGKFLLVSDAEILEVFAPPEFIRVGTYDLTRFSKVVIPRIDMSENGRQLLIGADQLWLWEIKQPTPTSVDSLDSDIACSPGSMETQFDDYRLSNLHAVDAWARYNLCTATVRVIGNTNKGIAITHSGKAIIVDLRTGKVIERHQLSRPPRLNGVPR